MYIQFSASLSLNSFPYFGILQAMVKKINVAGVEIDNYTVRESILNLDACLGAGGFYTIQEITMGTIMQANANEKVKEALAKVTHSVIADVGILDVAGENTLQRKHEVADRDFFFEFMKRIERNNKTVFLLGEDAMSTQAAHDFIMSAYNKCRIVGMGAVEEYDGCTDAIINEINSLDPYVLISVLPMPRQELFLLENRDKISSTVWYGIGQALVGEKHHPLVRFVKHYMDVRQLLKIKKAKEL